MPQLNREASLKSGSRSARRGPTLSRATAKVTKVSRNGNGESAAAISLVIRQSDQPITFSARSGPRGLGAGLIVVDVVAGPTVAAVGVLGVGDRLVFAKAWCSR